MFRCEALGVTIPPANRRSNPVSEKTRDNEGSGQQPAELTQLAANLYAVKLAWRNEVMHPKDTYTQEEAENLINQVRILMQQIVNLS